jgi:hypothetical protein
MDRPTVRKVREALETHLAKLGLKLTAEVEGAARYDSNSVVFKVRLTEKNTDGSSGDSKEEKDFKAHGFLYGLKPEWLGQSYTEGGKSYTVRGLKAKARVNNVVVETDTGTRYVAPAQRIVWAMTRQTAAVA